MTYSPHTWQPGEIISSARLNALEQGVAAGGGGNGSSPDILVHITGEVWDNTNKIYTISEVELQKYDHDSVVRKIINGEPVFGYAYKVYSYNDRIDGCSEYNTIIPISSAYLFVDNLNHPTDKPDEITCHMVFQNMRASVNWSTGIFSSIINSGLELEIGIGLDEETNEYVTWFDIIKGFLNKNVSLS